MQSGYTDFKVDKELAEVNDITGAAANIALQTPTKIITEPLKNSLG
jgi:hypothetical protein